MKIAKYSLENPKLDGSKIQIRFLMEEEDSDDFELDFNEKDFELFVKNINFAWDEYKKFKG